MGTPWRELGSSPSSCGREEETVLAPPHGSPKAALALPGLEGRVFPSVSQGSNSLTLKTYGQRFWGVSRKWPWMVRAERTSSD